MRFYLLDEAGGFQFGDDALACLETVEAAEPLRRVVIEARVRREDVDLFEPVPLTDFIVVEVVCRRDLHATRPESGIDVAVGDHRDGAVGERQLSCWPTSAR